MDNLLDAARQVVSTTAARWQNLIQSVPEEVLARQPAPGEWSALECLQHLLIVERLVIPVRVKHILGGRPELIPYDPDAPREPVAELDKAPRELLLAFTAERRSNEAVLAGLTPGHLTLSSYHPELGVVTLGMLVNLWAAHDLQHTVQGEKAVMQVFIPGSGPWRFEFADEDVEAHAVR
jgi:hypothetical protein